MWLWAWFTGGGWILMAGGVVVLGLVAAAVVVGATARKRDYPGRHVLAEVAGQAPEQDFYGSMSLADEPQRIMLPRLGAHLHLWGSGHSCDSPAPHDGPCVCECGIEQPYDAPGWREQIAAELSSEALDGGPTVSGPEGATGVNAPLIQLDSGPGDTSLAPGPDPSEPPAPGPDWLDRQLAAHVAWVARMAPMVTGWSVAA